MKTRTWLWLGCLIFSVYSLKGQTFEVEIPQEREKPVPQERAPAPNRIIGKRANYSGVFVQIMKAKPVWQTVNPLAPKAYGEGYQNTTQNPYSGEMDGLKLFSIEF